MMWLIAFAGKMGVPEPLRRAVAIVGFIVTIIALLLAIRFGWSFWLARHDDAVIAEDRAQANAEAAAAALDAERKAGAAKDARDRAFATEQAQLQEEADAAASAGASPLDALFERLR